MKENTLVQNEANCNIPELMQHIDNCPYRLPCGLCKELNRTCPQVYATPIWGVTNEAK